jgi:NAD(P)-dependent dehydrogenase (short-subunit alcohol dehydrogenase family)
VAGLGIHVTAVEPGGFRTDWAGRSLVRSPRSIADYDAMFDGVRATRRERDGKQAGDPAKAAEAILRLAGTANPPGHLLLGNDAVHFVREKLAALAKEIEIWEQISRGTDFTE